MQGKKEKRRRLFLLRLMITTLAVCMIPMILLSVRMFSNQQEQLRENERGQIQETTVRAAELFDDCMQDIQAMQYQHLTLYELSDAALGSGVSAEIEAIDILKIRASNQPFFKNMGFLRLGGTNVAYLADGKHELRYYAPTMLAMTETELLEGINRLNGAGFLPWNPSTLSMVYLYPEYLSNSRRYERIGIYIIGRGTLLSGMSHLLTDGVELDRIEAEDGTLIYHSGDSSSDGIWADGGGDTVTVDGDVYYRYCAQTPQGIRVYMHKPESPLTSSMQARNSSVLMILFLIAGVTMLCALLAVYYNYQPVRQALSRMEDEHVSTEFRDEIQFLYNAYSEQKTERQQLETRLDQQRRLILDRVYKCLLNGKALSGHEYELLHWQNTLFFVAASDMTETVAPDAADVRRLDGMHIRLVSMKADRVDAFICFVNDESRREQNRQIQNVRKFISQEAHLGVSRVYRTPEDFHMAYVESTLAERVATEGGATFAEDLSRQQLPLFFENNFDTMQLINRLHNNDAAAVDSVRSMMNDIEAGIADENDRRYAEFRLMEHLRNAMNKAGAPCDEWRFSRIMALHDVSDRQDALCCLILEALHAREEVISMEREQLGQEMMMYIERNFSNSGLSLEMLAEAFGLSPTAASKIFKDVVGRNFKKYVNERRITEARLLLDTTQESISSISEKVGFSSASYFIQVFKASEGMTPASRRAGTEE